MEGNNRRLVIALGSALGFSLLVIAFLLGRVSAERSEPVRVAEAVQAAPAPVEPTVPAAPLPAPAEDVFPLGEDDAAHPVSAGWAPPATIPAPSFPDAVGRALSVPQTADQQATLAYFAQIDRVDDVGAGDPQAFANSMLQSVSSGDFSGFDDLLAKSKEQQERLRRIAPPQACVDHHRLAVALSADSVAMLERLKAALVKGDTTALFTIAAEGRTLEEQANQLKSMGESIKQTLGL